MGHANTTLVTLAWLKTLPGITADMVGPTRPQVEKWASTGFISIGPSFPGTSELYLPFRRPIVQIDFWAVTPNSKVPNHPRANELGEIVMNGVYRDLYGSPPITLPAGINPAYVTTIYAVSEVRPVPEPQSNFAHYAVDMHVGWMEQGPVAGAN
jgi:hypothetical protein